MQFETALHRLKQGCTLTLMNTEMKIVTGKNGVRLLECKNLDDGEIYTLVGLSIEDLLSSDWKAKP